MLLNIFDFIAKLKSKIAKPDAKITIEVCDTITREGLKFRFLWFDETSNPSYLKLSLFIQKDMVKYIRDEDGILDYIIHMVNLELKKISEGEI